MRYRNKKNDYIYNNKKTKKSIIDWKIIQFVHQSMNYLINQSITLSNTNSHELLMINNRND